MSALNYAKIQTDNADKLLKILTNISVARGYSAADAQLEAGKTIGKTRAVLTTGAPKDCGIGAIRNLSVGH